MNFYSFYVSKTAKVLPFLIRFEIAKILNLTKELGEKRIETKQINSRDDEYNAPIV